MSIELTGSLKMEIKDRKTQKVILLISIAIIVWGVFKLISGDFDSFFKIDSSTNPTNSRSVSFSIIFLFAIVMGFFSAKNLFKSK